MSVSIAIASSKTTSRDPAKDLDLLDRGLFFVMMESKYLLDLDASVSYMRKTYALKSSPKAVMP